MRLSGSNNPRLSTIKKILSNLSEKEKFFSIDEYGPFAIKIQGGRSLVPPGTTKTVPQWQKSKGSLIVTASLELSTNQITHFYSEKKNTKEMIKLLNLLNEKYSNEKCIYFSWDAASWHASKELYKRVDEINSEEFKTKNKTPIVKLAPLPTCAQFLNVIESVFSGMARAIIHNSDYKSVDCTRPSLPLVPRSGPAGNAGVNHDYPKLKYSRIENFKDTITIQNLLKSFEIGSIMQMYLICRMTYDL